MSPSAYITPRKRKSGTRYVVRYRLGGRYHPEGLIHGGTFKRKADAVTRRDFIISELAAGRDPRAALALIQNPPAAPPGLRATWDAWIASRIDVTPGTRGNYKAARDRLCPLLGDTTQPAALTPELIQQAVNALAGQLTPGTLRTYMSALQMALDYADLEPNPARSRKVRLPAHEETEVEPPTNPEWEGIKAKIRPSALLPVRLIEALALRADETIQLRYGDIDFADGRIRVSRARTKSRAGQRWLPVPQQLLDEIAALCPLEDRGRDRRVFPGLTESRLWRAIDKACSLAKIAHYHPHDLRHRRISLWFAHGFDQVAVRTWAGHARASMSSDVYGHVVVSSDDEWRDFWMDAYQVSRVPRPPLPGEVPVRSERSTDARK